MSISQASAPQEVKDALEICSHPDQFCDVPSLFQWSWATLKAERGQDMNLHQLPPMAHRIEPTGGVIARIRSHARANNIPLRCDNPA